MISPSDEALMDSVKEGDVVAFDGLLKRHGKPLFNFILRYVGDCTEAEDLLQTTFVKILQAAPSFNSRQRFTTWAYRIASNLCVDHWRRSQHRKTASLEDRIGDESGATIADLIHDPGADPDSQLESRELHEAIRNAVLSLPVDLRSVVILAHYDGMPYSDVAEILGIPVGTVKSRMHHAMGRLREELKDWM